MAIQQQLTNENVSESVLNITIDNLKDFQQFKSDEFFVRGQPWHLEFKKANNHSLGVFLHSNFKHGTENTYMFMNTEVNLLSWKPHVAAHCAIVTGNKYSTEYNGWGKAPVILWNQLMDPEKGYVMYDKCKFKIKIVATG